MPSATASRTRCRTRSPWRARACPTPTTSRPSAARPGHTDSRGRRLSAPDFAIVGPPGAAWGGAQTSGRLSMPANMRFMNPAAIAKPGGYTHVVEVTGPGRIVYIAGQLGLKQNGEIAGDFRAQCVQAFENLKAALAAVGATFGDVVKLNNYLIDISQN